MNSLTRPHSQNGHQISAEVALYTLIGTRKAKGSSRGRNGKIAVLAEKRVALERACAESHICDNYLD